jgi:uncharacterized membrane protein
MKSIYPSRFKQHIRRAWDYLHTSFWFVPSLMVLSAVGLVAAGLALDYDLKDFGRSDLPWVVYMSQPDDARELLSTLLASMITMASLVFSITMVVLTLAANQFGPRLVRNFMDNPQTQVVLGTFVMTIVYCLLILASVGYRAAPASDVSLPYATVSVAIVLAFISVCLLVLYLHILARSIMSETVIERVGHELDKILSDLEPLQPGSQIDEPEKALPDDFKERAVFFGSNDAGYVQTIEVEQVIKAAKEADILVGFYFRAGDMVVEGGRDIGIYPPERCTKELADAIRRAITVGKHRTPVQDITFPIRHMVEIAVRALSPGINDPYTATAVIDRLSVTLCQMMNKNLPSATFKDGDGSLRLVWPRPSYASLISAAFDQIRQNGADKPLVVIHLVNAIGRIADHVKIPLQTDALKGQLEVILNAAKREVDDQSDLEAIEKRAGHVRPTLSHLNGGYSRL